MAGKRRKSKGVSLDTLITFHDDAPIEAFGSVSSLDSLPTETLLLIFAKLQFPSRQHASLVCRRWRDLLLEPPFCRHLGPGQSLSEALQTCNPGDTLICPPGMYQETLLVDKPVRLVAEDHWRRAAEREGIMSPASLSSQEQRSRRRRGRGLPDWTGAEPAEGAAAGPAAALAAPAGPRSGPGAAPSTLRGPPAPAPFQGGQHPQLPREPQLRQRSGGSAGRQRGASAAGTGVGRGAAGVAAWPAVLSVTVLSLRPPVVVMDSRCCFVGLEFHTSVPHNEVSICCYGPNCPLARFDHCTFSGLTGLRVPYSKGSQTRLELYDCNLMGTTQSLAAVQMDAGQLRLVRCAVQNNSVGVEVGPEALARLEHCELRWCGTALVVDGCLALAHCRLWGNGKVGNLATESRLRAAQGFSEACMAAGGPLVPPPQQQPHRQRQRQHLRQAPQPRGGPEPPPLVSPSREPRAAVANAATTAADVAPASAPLPEAEMAGEATPTSRHGRRSGRRSGGDAQAGSSAAGAAAAAVSGCAGPSTAPAWAQPPQPLLLAAVTGSAGGSGGGGGSGSFGASPGRLAALAAAQWTEVSEAFSSRHQLVRVVGCEVAAPQLIVRAGLHKEVRKKARELVRQVYGEPDNDLFPEWEVLVHSDLDSDLDEEDSSVTSGSVMADDEDLEDEDEDPLDAADDPDLDESGGSHSSGSDTDDSDAVSNSGSGGHPDETGSDGEEDGDLGAGGEAEGEGEDEEWGGGGPMSSGEDSTDNDSDSSDSNDSSGDSSSGGGGDGGSSGGDGAVSSSSGGGVSGGSSNSSGGGRGPTGMDDGDD